MIDPLLKKQYGIIEDSRYLCEESDIVPYFKDCGIDFFDCGQGYSQDEASVIVAIHETFYKVIMKASIMSAKQDRGDRLYWVEDITSVTYEEILKPEPKSEEIYTFHIKEYLVKSAIAVLKDADIEYSLSKTGEDE